MNTKSRITSILTTTSLDATITGIPSFDLTNLNIISELDFELPSNLRLGHLAEKIVSELIKSSSNYKVLYENVQIIEDAKTIGEIDFMLEEIRTKQLIHMELAYKFYLFDPSISSDLINNWIGPNRNDSLKTKLDKLKRKQFPLLFHPCAKSTFNTIEIGEVSQALCFLVSLFIPYKYKANFSPIYQKAIKGYYVNFETFISLDSPENAYYFPLKKEWGMEPSKNELWTDFRSIETKLRCNLNEKQAVMCWQKHYESYLTFFIVWW